MLQSRTLAASCFMHVFQHGRKNAARMVLDPDYRGCERLGTALPEGLVGYPTSILISRDGKTNQAHCLSECATKVIPSFPRFTRVLKFSGA
jgi:hypothetical protein